MVWQRVLGPSDHDHVVLNGVPLTAATPHTPSTDRPFTLITVGRLVPIKGVDIQLRALASLRRRVPDAQLLVVGDGPERDRLEALSRELGISDAISWLGFRNDPGSWYRRADVFLCTSYNETFSLTLCEAMNHGLACVAPRVGGPAEIIRSGTR